MYGFCIGLATDQGLTDIVLTAITEQDRGLEALSDTIARQREISTKVFEEIDLHNMMLDELDESFDRTTAEVTGATAKLRRYLNHHGQEAIWGVALVGVLTIVVIVVVVLVV